MLYLTRLTVAANYVTGILPALIMAGVGLGLVFSTSINGATLGVEAADAGVASATVSASQQIGASLGIALLSTVAASAVTSYLTGAGTHPTRLLLAQAAVHGDTAAFVWAAARSFVSIALSSSIRPRTTASTASPKVGSDSPATDAHVLNPQRRGEPRELLLDHRPGKATTAVPERRHGGDRRRDVHGSIAHDQS
jgi:hypothetical protein